ncbi:MAG: response regulator, partial [Rhodocyclaceae bacterium]|nr:response regulator [Rhodocyclaceae bacterium]
MRLLQRLGAQVSLAADGAQALALAGQQPFDLVLMDCRLPGMDGWETTRRLRAQGWRGPVVALTANATEEDRRACLAAGMDDFLPKPLERDEQPCDAVRGNADARVGDADRRGPVGGCPRFDRHRTSFAVVLDRVGQ